MAFDEQLSQEVIPSPGEINGLPPKKIFSPDELLLTLETTVRERTLQNGLTISLGYLSGALEYYPTMTDEQRVQAIRSAIDGLQTALQDQVALLANLEAFNRNHEIPLSVDYRYGSDSPLLALDEPLE